MIYIIDIDDTICFYENEEKRKDYNNAIPCKRRIKKINKLYNSGDKIIFWTSRGTTTGKDWEELTKKQLSDWGVLYHELRLGKPFYDIFIDDKAINSGVFFE